MWLLVPRWFAATVSMTVSVGSVSLVGFSVSPVLRTGSFVICDLVHRISSIPLRCVFLRCSSFVVVWPFVVLRSVAVGFGRLVARLRVAVAGLQVGVFAVCIAAVVYTMVSCSAVRCIAW